MADALTLDLRVDQRPRRSLFIAICVGITAPGCGREYAQRLVPWKGEPVVESGGVCPRCWAREMVVMQTQRSAR